MLVRNLTQSNLNLKGVNGVKITLPPLKIVNIDELEFPVERIKRYFGHYVHILADKCEVKENEIPTKPKEDLELQESNSNVPTTDETSTEEKTDEGTGVENNTENIVTEDADNDTDDVDKLVDSILEEIESENAGKEEVSEKPAEKTTKATKKTGKKASKKS